jgi:microcystin-dependent protein
MSQFSFPWTSVGGDRAITSAHARALNAHLVSDGALAAFAGSTTGTSLAITAGAAMVKGAYLNVDSGVTLELSSFAASVWLVARLDLTARSLSLVCIEGSLSRTEALWDLPIATVTKAGGVWRQPVFEYVWASMAGEPAGSYKTVATEAAPSGYLVCDGSAKSRVIYDRLFAAIGTAYGAGDGSTTFNLPNLKGKVLVGLDSAQTEFDAVGETGGEKAHVLTSSEMPAHNHPVTVDNYSGYLLETVSAQPYSQINAVGGSLLANGKRHNHTASAGNTGGGTSHNNLQPYVVGLICIKA